MTTVAAIKGKMGDYEYYQATMKPQDVISKSAAAINYFTPETWEEMGNNARLQREPDFKRIKEEIAPYLIRSKKRFFNSIVVLLDESKCDFQSLKDFPATQDGKSTFVSKLLLPAYQEKSETLGFLEIRETKGMLILDGQHRMLALKTAINEQNELREIFKKQEENFDDYRNHEVEEDDISVIFLKCEDLEEKMKIFEDLNTYAKRQSKDVEIFGSVSNPWYVIARKFTKNPEINQEIDGKAPKIDFLKDFVQKKGTALGPRNKPITTATHIVQIVKFLTRKMKFKSQMQLDTMVEDMEMAQNICNRELNEFFLNVGIFKKILVTEASNKNVTKYREDSGKDALILKPMPHVALFKAIHFLKENTDMDIDAIYRAANKIDFSYEKGSNHQWLKWVISDAGTITTSGKVEGVLTRMLVYFIAGKPRCEKFENGQEWLNELFENYKELAGDVSALPEPKFK
jgi:DNA sulfur modification protein DndB